MEHLSLYQFVQAVSDQTLSRRQRVPHFVGMASQPCYPITTSAARGTLIIYTPWRNAFYHHMTEHECLGIFNEKMIRNEFPYTVKLSFQRARDQFMRESKLKDDTECNLLQDEPMADDDKILVSQLSSIPGSRITSLPIGDYEYDLGVHYDWSSRLSVRIFYVSLCTKMKQFIYMFSGP
jgi:hypothetical protein